MYNTGREESHCTALIKAHDSNVRVRVRAFGSRVLLIYASTLGYSEALCPIGFFMPYTQQLPAEHMGLVVFELQAPRKRCWSRLLSALLEPFQATLPSLQVATTSLRPHHINLFVDRFRILAKWKGNTLACTALSPTTGYLFKVAAIYVQSVPFFSPLLIVIFS